MVYYSSLFKVQDTNFQQLSTYSPGYRWLKLPCFFAAKGKGSGGVKTAKLYAWVALQTLPEEMVISPCLLDFLEKALETIPITPVERNYAGLFVAPADLYGSCS